MYYKGTYLMSTYGTAAVPCSNIFYTHEFKPKCVLISVTRLGDF